MVKFKYVHCVKCWSANVNMLTLAFSSRHKYSLTELWASLRFVEHYRGHLFSVKCDQYLPTELNQATWDVLMQQPESVKTLTTLTPEARGSNHPHGNTSTMNAWSARVDLVMEAQRADCSETQPPIHTQLRCCMVWFNFTTWRGVLKTCPVTTQPPKNVTHTHTHKPAHGSPIFDTCWEKGGAVVLARYLWYHDIIRPGDGVLCHALFGFPALTVLAITPALGKHVGGGYNWDWPTTARRGKEHNNPGGECVWKKFVFESKCVIIIRCSQSRFHLPLPVPSHSSDPWSPCTHHNTNTVLLVTHDIPLSTFIFNKLYNGHTHVLWSQIQTWSSFALKDCASCLKCYSSF